MLYQLYRSRRMGTIVVKNVDRDVYRRLKSVAALKGCTVGEALTEAMRLWLALGMGALT